GVAFNDAGVGVDRAGIGGLLILDELGTPAVAVSHRTARIGDARDTAERGVIHHFNVAASAIGIRAGMRASAALQLMVESDHSPEPIEHDTLDSRHLAVEGVPAVWALDSASLVRA